MNDKQQKIKVLALFGKSGAGKDTLSRWLCQNIDNAHQVIHHTTRPRREGQVQGREYHFVSDNQFSDMVETGEMLHYSIFNDWFYGISQKELQKGKINIGVFNINDINGITSFHKEIDILPVLVETSDKIRLLRSLNRQKNPNCKEICRRFLADEEDFIWIYFNYSVYNNDKLTDDFSNFFSNPAIRSFLKV